MSAVLISDVLVFSFVQCSENHSFHSWALFNWGLRLSCVQIPCTRHTELSVLYLCTVRTTGIQVKDVIKGLKVPPKNKLLLMKLKDDDF